MTELLLTFVALAAGCGLVVVLGLHVRRRITDEHRAATWHQALDLVAQRPDLALVQVTHNYQHGRRGTKSYVRWSTNGRPQDTWFWDRRPTVGDYFVIRPSVGWGPHNQNPATLYVAVSDVALRVSPVCPRAAERIAARARRRHVASRDDPPGGGRRQPDDG